VNDCLILPIASGSGHSCGHPASTAALPLKAATGSADVRLREIWIDATNDRRWPVELIRTRRHARSIPSPSPPPA
jgi:hypothetical protein